MIVLSTGSLYNYGLVRVFALAARTGYDGVEVIVDTRWDSRDPAYLRRLSSDYGLPIVALHSPFVADVQGWPPDPLGRLEHTVALAKELGVPLVVAHLPFRLYGLVGQLNFLGNRSFILPIPWPKRETYYYFLLDGRLHDFESSSGVIIALENMPAHRVLGLSINLCWFNSPEKLTRFSHLTLDTTHLGTWGLDPTEVYGLLNKRVVHIHLSNFDGRQHRSPLDGHLLLAKLLRRLAHNRYKGAISVESQPDALDAQDEAKCQAALERALAFCREQFSS